jgi:hypothetical protein
VLTGVWSRPLPASRPAHTYHLYGLHLRSELRLPCPEASAPAGAELDLFEASLSYFSRARREASRSPTATKTEWFCHVRLPDGADYVRWSGLFEFLIAGDGRRIAVRASAKASREVFHTYLLGQVLSFALLKQGVEPLHATAVIVDGEAVGFLGDTGYGKSSLGAAFLHAGCPLLTDDVLVVKEESHGLRAYPGPPRIKLFPESTALFLRRAARGIPMNPYTSKLIIPLPAPMAATGSRPLKAIYVLRPPTAKTGCNRITIRRLTQRRACLKLIANTFNTLIREPARLTQQFRLATRLAAVVPVKFLSYPRGLSRLPAVVEAVRSDLSAMTA